MSRDRCDPRKRGELGVLEVAPGAAGVDEQLGTQTTSTCSHFCGQALRPDWTRTDTHGREHLVRAALWTLMDIRIPVRFPWGSICRACGVAIQRR
jgi:hypothetical protein